MGKYWNMFFVVVPVEPKSFRQAPKTVSTVWIKYSHRRWDHVNVLGLETDDVNWNYTVISAVSLRMINKWCTSHSITLHTSTSSFGFTCNNNSNSGDAVWPGVCLTGREEICNVAVGLAFTWSTDCIIRASGCKKELDVFSVASLYCILVRCLL